MSGVSEYVNRLKRRRDYLKKDTDNHYAKSELAALEWAIAYIESTPVTAATHKRKYFETKKEENNDKNQIHNDGSNSDTTVREHPAEH